MEEIGSEGSYRSLESGVTAVPVEHRLWRPHRASRFPRTCGTPVTTMGPFTCTIANKNSSTPFSQESKMGEGSEKQRL